MHELKKQNPYMRLIFLFSFFGLSIGDAFNVLFIKEMAESFASPENLELFISLPVTAMSGMMIAGVFSSHLILQKKGNIVVLMRAAILITAAGMLFRVFAFHYLLLLLGFMAVGFGYGCFYIGIRYYAYLFESEKERAEAIAFMSGGGFAGQCMGTVLGGIMAGQMPYRMVYILSVILLIIPFFLIRKVKIDVTMKLGSLSNSIKVLKNYKALLYLFLMVVPLFACTVFTSYTVPLSVDGFGYSATVVSALLLGSYLIAAYAGPLVTRLMVKTMSSLSATYIYCIGAALLITAFSLGNTFPLLVMVVLALGFMDAFGPNVMTTAYTDIENNNEYSDTDALIIYILFTRIGMTIAPSIILLFGSTLALSGMLIIGMAFFMIIGTVINITVHNKNERRQ